MRGLPAAELLHVWERGVRQHPVDRALTVLSACLDEPVEELARASVGRRDRALLALYEQMAGARLDGFAECPACGERLEYSLAVRDLLAGGECQESDTEFTMTAGEISLRLRLVNSLDLADAAGYSDADAAARVLAERSILEAHSDVGPIAVADLPEAIIDQAGSRLAQADPQAETLINLACAACSHAWQVVLDIESFLWAKINALAKRLLREVHVLASAYGWREAEILSMSAARREFYLEIAS